ncbi:hypothetical protein DSM112329_03799 [Paraconexibacter sp. AEG42_29]|uniref:DUF5666 domain-containing protein n=1 Tax=Paraconexibacter sp. AEG42_29 TaxID=2997339 RepID=A0AAU7AZ75_9ACTN
MRIRHVLPIAVLLGTLAVPAAAGPIRTYTGKATATDGRFRYGKVIVKTNGTKVTKIEIQAVTTIGCGGFMTVVFAPGDPEIQITKGSATIKGGKFSVRYRPVRSVEEQETEIKATITAKSVTGGTFKSGDLSTPAPLDGLCANGGRFSAKR